MRLIIWSYLILLLVLPAASYALDEAASIEMMSQDERRKVLTKMDSFALEKKLVEIASRMKAAKDAMDRVTFNRLAEAYWDACLVSDRADLVAELLKSDPDTAERLQDGFNTAVLELKNGNLTLATGIFQNLAKSLYRPDQCNYYLACIRAGSGDLAGRNSYLEKADRYYSQTHKRPKE